MFRGILYACGACFVFLFATSLQCVSQEINTYTLDGEFDTGELFNAPSPIMDIIEDEQGRIIAVGEFAPIFGEFVGSGRVFEDGSPDFSWYEYADFSLAKIAPFFGDRYLSIGAQNTNLDDLNHNGEPFLYPPYDTVEVENNFLLEYVFNEQFESEFVGDFKIMPDNKVLIAGEFLSDSLNPERRQHLVRVNPDGSHDPTFPLVECDPNSGYVSPVRILNGPNGAWYLSGYFEGVNGHYSPNLVRLHEDFSVDTSFTSPFISPVNQGIGGGGALLVEENQKVWFAGSTARLEAQPDEPFYLCRLMPDGSLDTTFNSPTLRKDTTLSSQSFPPTGVANMMPMNDNYLLYGTFSFYNDTARGCIAMIDEHGHLVDGYFEELGADSGSFDNWTHHPGITDVLELNDGSLVVAGLFSHFGGEQHYNMARLKPGTIGFHETEKDSPIRVFPNPTSNKAIVSATQRNIEEIVLLNSLGATVKEFPVEGDHKRFEIDVSNLSPGLYLVGIKQSEGLVKSTTKLIVR